MMPVDVNLPNSENCCHKLFDKRLVVLDALSPRKTAALIAGLVLTVLMSATSLIGGIACAVLAGGALAGIAGFFVALFSTALLLISSMSLWSVLKKVSCEGSEEWEYMEETSITEFAVDLAASSLLKLAGGQ